MGAFSTINFPLSTVLVVSHEFCYVAFFVFSQFNEYLFPLKLL